MMSRVRRELNYEILADASYGKLTLNGTDLNVGETFTQQDINDGKVEFRHGGDETATADSIALQVDDGAGSVSYTHLTLPTIYAV